MFKHHYDGAWVQAELPTAVQENKPALSQAECLREWVLWASNSGKVVASMCEPKMFLDEQGSLQFFCDLNSPKNVTCPLGLWREFTSPI